MWPYSDEHPENEGDACPTCAFAKKPSQGCYNEAIKHKIVLYSRLSRNLNVMKGCLASGFPFVFGFTCYVICPLDRRTA
jgi:hypothetical protein